MISIYCASFDMAATIDNRHGEPMEKKELRDAGADPVVGLSTKNLGGVTVFRGGHTAGRYDSAEDRVHRTIILGSGREAGVMSGIMCSSHTGSPLLLYAIGEVSKIVAPVVVSPDPSGPKAILCFDEMRYDTTEVTRSENVDRSTVPR